MSEQLLSNTYCDRPYTELHIEEDGSVTPCCVMPSNRFPMGKNIKEYANGKELRELKNQLSNGIQHKNCEYCWKNESSGVKSHRISKIRGGGLRSVHIRLNNVCNFKCRMCGPAFSSTWAQENKKHNIFTFEDNSITKNAFDNNSDYLFDLLKKNINLGVLEHISISGGEPLITDAHFTLLSFLIDNNLTNISLGYSTNLSVLNYKGIDLMTLWRKFKQVNLEASLDGWGRAVEYSRTGFNQAVFLSNFKKAAKYVKTINCVVNIYSVWSLPQVEKFRELGINIVYSPCHLPIHCNPQILMREDKNKLFQLYKKYPSLLSVYEKLIDNDLKEGYHNNDFGVVPQYFSLEDIRKKMVSFNLLLDEYRETNFFDVFPMYTKYKEI